MSANWVLLREYASQLEADLDIGVLMENDVPHLVQGPPVGVFGPGFTGATGDGVRVFVPHDSLELATELLEGFDQFDPPA